MRYKPQFMKATRIFTFMLIMGLLSVSCHHIDNAEEGAISSLQPICFDASRTLDYDISTRSSMNSLKSDGFGLIGYNSIDKDFDAAAPGTPVFDNYRLISDDGRTWRYADAVAYWDILSQDKHTFLAYHPYDEDMEGTSLAIPTDDIIISECVDYLAAEPVINQTSKDGVSLEFSHIMSRINPSVRLANAYDGQQYRVSSIRLDNVREFSSFNLATSSFSSSPASTHSISATTENILNPVLATTSDVTTVDPVYISPYAYASGGECFTITLDIEYTFTNSLGVSVVNNLTRSVDVSKDLAFGTEYDLCISFSSIQQEVGIDVSVTLEEYSKDSMSFPLFQTKAVNLSENGTANSYIIPKAGQYRFDATYRGNSTTEEVGEIASMEVLWESVGNEVGNYGLISTLGFADKTVYFNAMNKRGNVLIAAKDKDGTILWSWHLWLTETPGDQEYRNNAGTVMDRNLGAISAVPEDGVKTHGLFYQWGRKDPFVGLDDMTSVYTSKYMEGDSDHSHREPTVFYEGDSSDNWMSAYDRTRWDSVGDGTGMKTVHDPCPPGYRVPIAGGDRNIGCIWGVALNNFTLTPMTWDSQNKGYDLTGYLTDDSPCWYPTPGSISEDMIKISEGAYGYIWFGSGASSAGVGNKKGWGIYINTSFISLDYTFPINGGRSVRCVKE